MTTDCVVVYFDPSDKHSGLKKMIEEAVIVREIAARSGAMSESDTFYLRFPERDVNLYIPHDVEASTICAYVNLLIAENDQRHQKLVASIKSVSDKLNEL